MNDTDLREVIGRLEATEALAKLFKNLWFDQIKQQIRDEKVRAYLMVFDDAFPPMNHIAQFARRSAEVLAEGKPDPEGWRRLREEFAALGQALLQRPVAAEGIGEAEEDREVLQPEPLVDVHEDDLSEDEKAALESVDQSDIDSLFAGGKRKAPAETEDIDALFASRGDQDEGEGDVSEEEVESFLHGEEEEQDRELLDEAEAGEEETESEDEDLVALLEDEVEEVEEEEAEEDALAQEEEEAEEVVAAEEEEAETEAEEIEEVDLTELLGEEEEGTGISEDEMAALLDDEEEEEEEKEALPPPPPPPPPKAAAKAKSVAKPAAKAKAKPGDKQAETSGNGEESISQDEIDALFG